MKLDDYGNLKYYIPGELLLDEYWTQKVHLYLNDEFGENWIPHKYASRLLEWSCGLTPQEYFDLLVLHINDKYKRPRCIWCKSFVPFSGRITWGYNQSKYWDKVLYTYCSNSCAKSFQSNNTDLFPNLIYNQENFGYYAHEGIKGIYNAYRRFLELGDPKDEVKVYEAVTHDSKFKFGLTASSLNDRSFREQFNSGYKYESITLIEILPRIEAANLEASIKIELGSPSEYYDIEFRSKILDLIHYKLANRPIACPFK